MPPKHFDPSGARRDGTEIERPPALVSPLRLGRRPRTIHVSQRSGRLLRPDRMAEARALPTFAIADQTAVLGPLLPPTTSIRTAARPFVRRATFRGANEGDAKAAAFHSQCKTCSCATAASERKGREMNFEGSLGQARQK